MRQLYKIATALLTASLLSVSGAAAQSSLEGNEVQSLLNHFYEFNSLELYYCRTLKPGITRNAASGTLRRYIDNETLNLKRDELYETNAKNPEYWRNFYARFYVKNIAAKYATLCDPTYRNTTKNSLGGDLRFRTVLQETLPDLRHRQLVFKPLQYEGDELVQDVVVKLKGEQPFVMRYTFKKENQQWRIWDIAEWYDSAQIERSTLYGPSLQSWVQEWKGR